jgi:hypothetical protein
MSGPGKARTPVRRVFRRIRHWTRPGRTPLASLETATPEMVRGLKAKKITTAEELWEAVEAPDPRPRLREIVKDTSLSQSDLVDLLVQAAARGDPLARPADFLAPAAALAVLALVLLRAGAVLGLPLGSTGPTPLTGLQVVATTELPTFHRISARDVIVQEKPRSFGAAVDTGQVIDRYTLAPIAKGEPVHRAELSARIGPGSDGRILAVQLARGAWRVNAAAGERAQLLLVPSAAGVAAGLRPVRVEAVVLRIERDGELRTATLAFTPAAVDSLAALLGAADAYLVKPES